MKIGICLQHRPLHLPISVHCVRPSDNFPTRRYWMAKLWLSIPTEVRVQYTLILKRVADGHKRTAAPHALSRLWRRDTWLENIDAADAMLQVWTKNIAPCERFSRDNRASSEPGTCPERWRGSKSLKLYPRVF
jgi:hypothetical protein